MSSGFGRIYDPDYIVSVHALASDVKLATAPSPQSLVVSNFVFQKSIRAFFSRGRDVVLAPEPPRLAAVHA